MKLVLEITSLESGTFGKAEEKTHWTRLWGKNAAGSYCRASSFGALAERLENELSRHVPKGEMIGTTRIVVDMTGEWKDDKEYTKADGTVVKNRYFSITTFDVLTGPVLELARLRRDGGDRLALAEQHRQEGRLDIAYRTIAEFAATICNRPLDLSALAEANAADDAEFGSVEEQAPDPEAAAAARFASMDGSSEPMEIAAAQPSETAADQPDAIEIHEASSHGSVDVTIASTVETAEEPGDAAEEGTADESGDVFDDEPPVEIPASNAPSAVAAPSVRPAPARPAAFRPGFRPRPPRTPGM